MQTLGSELPRSLSSGAERVLIAALQTARSERVPTSARHLLGALWQDESRASRLMRNCGLTADALEADFPCPQSETAPTESGAMVICPWSLAIVREAGRLAADRGREEEIGTEHLLLAIANLDSTVTEKFALRGVLLTNLTAQAEQLEGRSSAPLPADVQLRPHTPGRTETTATDRILDAAANRCREGLRVVEDYVRFTWNDRFLSSQYKQLRHDLSKTLQLAGSDRWVRSRDTRHDVGIGVSTVAERLRLSPLAVARTNAKRVEESLRTLEENLKLSEGELAGRVAAVRYQFYALEQTFEVGQSARTRLAGARFYLLASEHACPHGLGPVVRDALEAGVSIVQMREKTLSDRRTLDLAKSVREWTRAAGALFIINDRPDIADLCDADGVHLGQTDLTVDDARRIVGGRRLIGVSTHTLEQAEKAVLDGADYLGVGPVFPSQTKSFAELSGLEFVRSVASQISLPWFAIGGITADRLPALIDAGATRFALSQAICSAESPIAAVTELWHASASLG